MIAKFGPSHSIATFTVKVRGEMGCSVMSTLEGAESQADCYLSSRPIGVVDITYSEQCGHCRGSGRVRANRRRLSWKPCPVCKGAAETTPDTLLAVRSAPERREQACACDQCPDGAIECGSVE